MYGGDLLYSQGGQNQNRGDSRPVDVCLFAQCQKIQESN